MFYCAHARPCPRRTLGTASRLLERDAIVSLDLEKVSDRSRNDATLVRLKHVGVPAEWADDLKAQWTRDLTRLASIP